MIRSYDDFRYLNTDEEVELAAEPITPWSEMSPSKRQEQLGSAFWTSYVMTGILASHKMILPDDIDQLDSVSQQESKVDEGFSALPEHYRPAELRAAWAAQVDRKKEAPDGAVKVRAWAVDAARTGEVPSPAETLPAMETEPVRAEVRQPFASGLWGSTDSSRARSPSAFSTLISRPNRTTAEPSSGRTARTSQKLASALAPPCASPTKSIQATLRSRSRAPSALSGQPSQIWTSLSDACSAAGILSAMQAVY